MEPSIDIVTRRAPPFQARSEYGAHRQQYGELRVPDNDGPHRVAIGLHGGWWTPPYGTETMAHICNWISSHSHVATWNLGYRRIGEGGGWPNSVFDVINGVNHLASLATDHALDLSSVSIFGFSAGGYLAVMATLLSDCKSTPDFSIDFHIKSTISIAGAVSLLRCQELGLGQNAVTRFLRGEIINPNNKLHDSEPERWMTDQSRITLIHGTDDSSVPLGVSDFFHSKFPRNSTLYTIKGADHLELIDPKSPKWESMSKILLGDLKL